MRVEMTHPEDFETEATPEINADENRFEYEFNSLMGRCGRTFVFVDYLFEKRPSGLHGAVGTGMRPVHVDEAKRLKEEYLDRETSPLFHRYEELNTVQSWDDWISSQFEYEGYRLIYDQSYDHKYGQLVREQTVADEIMEADEIELVECVGGGRMFSDCERDFDVLYDSELLRLVQETEASGLGDYYE